MNTFTPHSGERPESAPAVEWYYVVGQEQRGPVFEPVFIAIIESGELDKKAKIWKEGFPKWIILENTWFLKFLPRKGPQHKDEAKTPPGLARENGVVDFEEALRILGLKPGFSKADLKNAYNKAVKMNHPDKVAHLDIEFRELAERKTKQINRANELLRQTFE